MGLHSSETINAIKTLLATEQLKLYEIGSDVVLASFSTVTSNHFFIVKLSKIK